MAEIQLYFFSSLILCIFASVVYCDCEIKIQGYGFAKPLLKKSVGTRNVNITNFPGLITLRRHEKLYGHCATKFKFVENSHENNYDDFNYCNRYGECNYLPPPQESTLPLTSISDIDLECVDRKVYIRYEGQFIKILNEPLSCNDFGWTIHEAAQPFPWCDSDAVSYLIVASAVKKAVAAFCFDLETMTLESVRYMASWDNFNWTQETISMRNHSPFEDLQLGVEIENFDSIIGDSVGLKWSCQSRHDVMEWDLNSFGVGVFEDVLLMQNQAGENFFSKYSNLFNVKWWHNSVNGNWKRFIKVFEEQVQYISYDVYMGSSGIAQTPVLNKHLETEFRALKIMGNSNTIPAYVWIYLSAINIDEEFVFIGYNSPYYEFFQPEEIIFCKDVCDEIPWLRDIRSTFRYSTLGVTFCCRADDVRNSKILNGFPRKYEPKTSVEESPEIESSTSEHYENVNGKLQLKFQPNDSMEEDDEQLQINYDVGTDFQ